MTNPYEPHYESHTTVTTDIPTSRRFYFGGFIAIAMISIFIGGVVGALVFGFVWQSAIPIWGIPAIGWWCASGLLVYLIRRSKLSDSGRIILAILLPIPAYILYVPVCVVSSMSTTAVLGGKDYGPTALGATLGSAFAFLVILMLSAAAVRALFRVRDSVTPPPLDEQV